MVCTGPKYFVPFFIAAELRCNKLILIIITFEPFNLNSILITNGSTGTRNYNAQTYFFMRMCKTYLDDMWYNLKALK